MTDIGTKSRIVLGVVTGAHGIRGEVKLKCFTAEPQAIAEYGPLARSDGGPALEIVAVRPVKDGVIVRFESVRDRNEADALKGVELFVPRDRLPEPAADEYYHADLIGLTGVRPDGTMLGEVIAVHNFGAGDVLEVRLAGSTQTVLLPFSRAVVPDVEPSAGRLIIDPPEGLIEE